MTPSEIKAYYSRPEIIGAIFRMCKEREVIPVFAGGIYGKRPNSVQFPGDILYFVKNGAVSFHCSVEHWKNPSALSNDMKRHDLDKLRTGWDLVLDVDSGAGIEVAKLTANLLIEEMQKNGVKNISVKFSGRRGFHIGVAWGAFSGIKVNGIENIAKMFPELPQKIASYLCSRIKDGLAEKILLADSSLKERMKDSSGGLNPYNIVEVEQNWSVRHLFRMPYAINDKSTPWKVSLPVNPGKIMEFSPDDAVPEKITAKIGFLEKFEEGECETLLKNALESGTEKKSKTGLNTRREEKKERLMRAIQEGGTIISETRPAATQDELLEIMRSGARREIKSLSMKNVKIPEEYFPPCIKKILAGLPDGRKRAIFILINFFRSVGCGWDEIGQKLGEWNAKNPEPVSESYLAGQFEYAKKQDKRIPPPNCSNAGYYRDMKVCIPDNYCAMIRNPAGYAARKALTGRKPGKGVSSRGRRKSNALPKTAAGKPKG